VLNTVNCVLSLHKYHFAYILKIMTISTTRQQIILP